MKKKWLGIRVAAGLCAALGWWGLLYPELALTPDTVKVSAQDNDGTVTTRNQEWSFDGTLYLELLNADREQITIRSRLLTELKELFKSFNGS
ncbi:MAG: hypothetical protein HFH97_13940 [Lachnospiraceae bacterium]|jgi:hypothetical protein|nr:hypothetical protein [uncultured Acetatifactor sp.]MCI9231104.1 hypothetical protein [Lachnospiraceae bacterium]MCI9573681.1 hypothetical protein [Lachnospiraceae bacterium]